MKKFTYSICYMPSIKANEDINYICFDNKIHVRFRDYNSEQVISGFEKKLSYLLTYLMNYSYLPKIVGKYDTEKLIKGFLNSSDITTIISTINIHCNTSIKGIKLKPNYNKKKEYKAFGNLITNYFPLVLVDDIIETGNLDSFLSTIKLSLEEYLFNDKYLIVLNEFKVQDINKKFTNRMNKKSNKILGNFDLEELW